MTPEQKERAKERRKIYIKSNRERIRVKSDTWFQKNKVRLKREGRCQWNPNTKERAKKLRKVRESDPVNKAKKLAYQREYAKKNREKIREKYKRWESKPTNKIGKRLRSRISSALKRNVSNQKAKKLDSNRKLLGISYDELAIYLKNLFIEGMSWDNYGSWHIDHIIPCKYFDLSIEENQRICFNYQNLNPMWSTDNQSKSDNIIIDNPDKFIDKIRQSIK